MAVAGLVPLIAAGVSAATAVAGTAVAVNSSEQQAKAQSNAADYNAAVAKNNATLASQNSIVAAQQGDVAQQRAYQEGAQREAMVKAAFGANGIQMNSGSALDLQADQARTTQQNVQAIGYNANVAQVGYLNQQTGFTSQAGLDTAQGQNDITAGNTSALSSIIGGASSVSSKWASFQQQGVGSQPQSGGVY